MGKRIYKVDWKEEALFQLYSLVNFELAEKIKDEVSNILAINPYGKFKNIQANVEKISLFSKQGFENLETNIKPLKRNLGGSWRIQIGDYRVLYDVFESEVLVSIFRFKNRLQEDVYSDKGSLENQ